MPIFARLLLLSWGLLLIAPGLNAAAETPFAVAQVQFQTLPLEQILDGVIEAVNKT